jgi:murein L,D-transpeptidase YafK
MFSFRRSGVVPFAILGFAASCSLAYSRRPISNSASHGRSSVASRNGFHVAEIGLATILTAPKSIVVDKSEKTLMLFKNGQKVKTYPVAIGKVEEGAKQAAGDWRTPEGVYYVAAHHPGSRYHKALKISYPNTDDAERGVAAGLITAEQAAAIAAATENGELPPQDTKLGYNIEIHGGYRLAPGKAGEPATIRSYTRGCVALTNPMIDEIYHWAADGIPVVIQP